VTDVQRDAGVYSCAERVARRNESQQPQPPGQGERRGEPRPGQPGERGIEERFFLERDHQIETPPPDLPQPPQVRAGPPLGPDQHLGKTGIARQQIVVHRRHRCYENGLRVRTSEHADGRRGEETIADVIAVQQQDAVKRHDQCRLPPVTTSTRYRPTTTSPLTLSSAGR